MATKKVEMNGKVVAVVCNLEKKIGSASEAMDVALSARYDCDTNCVAFSKDCFDDAFFVLSSGLAGEVLQKFTNYGIRCAIFGDYSRYTSKPLRDFIYESNKGHAVGFLSNEEEAVTWLMEK